ncbi:hypothetical protein DFP72DRAFT_1119962 [Ephemerocybe angulata]|uniref:Uncharacterized protein n=1 Tax=Ephemerocybe angulata TaxID=980116 RepID=A0A8H6H7V5_9AGAR|nr:hypothetical protein DFP72DRAFT_1119962 [Tulosesus angulatus]
MTAPRRWATDQQQKQRCSSRPDEAGELQTEMEGRVGSESLGPFGRLPKRSFSDEGVTSRRGWGAGPSLETSRRGGNGRDLGSSGKRRNGGGQRGPCTEEMALATWYPSTCSAARAAVLGKDRAAGMGIVLAAVEKTQNKRNVARFCAQCTLNVCSVRTSHFPRHNQFPKPSSFMLMVPFECSCIVKALVGCSTNLRVRQVARGRPGVHVERVAVARVVGARQGQRVLVVPDAMVLASSAPTGDTGRSRGFCYEVEALATGGDDQNGKW